MAVRLSVKESAPSRMVASTENRFERSHAQGARPVRIHDIGNVAEQTADQKRDNVRDGAHELLEPRKLAGACRTHGG